MDQQKLNTAVAAFVDGFKKDIVEKLLDSSISSHDIVQFVNEFQPPVIREDEIMKKKRVKNPIPFHEKCIAKRANGEQCSRRKKKDGNFCGTHSKACPHGTISVEENTDYVNHEKGDGVIKKQVEVWLEDINGIMYWINDTGTVYHPEDIKNNIENPRVIAHYEKNEVDGEEIYKITQEIHS
jgi:hypothetical protein